MIHFSPRRAVFPAMLISLFLWATAAAGAQETPKQERPPEQTNIGDKEITAFAKAYVEYHKIRQAYEAQLSNVQAPKERARIQHEGESKVKKALEKQGLTPEAYNRLFTAVNGNEQLRKKALKLIEAERKRS
jgi:hypothetical protein